MIYFFQIPEIVDETRLVEIPFPMAVSAQEQVILQEAQEFRQQFKLMCSLKKLEEIRSLRDGLVNYQDTCVSYLKTNVDFVSKISAGDR